MSNFQEYVANDCITSSALSNPCVPPSIGSGKVFINLASGSNSSTGLTSAFYRYGVTSVTTPKKIIKADKDSKTLIDRKDRKTKFIKVKYLKNTENEEEKENLNYILIPNDEEEYITTYIEEEKEIKSEKTFPNIANIETYNNKAMKMTFSDGSFTKCAINNKDSAEDLFFYNAATICYLKKLLDDGSNTSGTNVYNKFLEIFSKVVKEVEKEKNKEKEKEAERKHRIKNKQKKKSRKNQRLLETLKRELKDVK